MIHVYVVCEGQTEESFVNYLRKTVFANLQIYLIPRLVPTSKGNKGGALTYERVRSFVIKCLKENDEFIVTTFFDLYALNNNFPDFELSQKQNDVYKKVSTLEDAFKKDIVQDNFNFSNRFFPYIQPYEFEGLLFTDISKLTEIETTWNNATKTLQSIRDNVETPEHINNGYETKPSARLAQYLNNPNYRKILHGTLAIEEIGIDKLLAECQHFSEWYKMLYQLINR